MTVQEAKPKTQEESAYQQLKHLAQIYLSTREKLATTPRAQYMLLATRLAVAAFLAGLPETVLASFKPVKEGDMFLIEVKKPRGVVHKHYITQEEYINISALLDQYLKQRTSKGRVSVRSMIRMLHYVLHDFKENLGIQALSYRDVYALKAKTLGLELPFRYPRKSYKSTILIINEAYRKMGAPGLV